MSTTIRLRIKRDIDTVTEKKIMRLKGSLIAKSFTHIIHIDDEGEDFYINYFTPDPETREEAIAFIDNYIIESGIVDIINLL
jgi:hypothetical protein